MHFICTDVSLSTLSHPWNNWYQNTNIHFCFSSNLGAPFHVNFHPILRPIPRNTPSSYRSESNSFKGNVDKLTSQVDHHNLPFCFALSVGTLASAMDRVLRSRCGNALHKSIIKNCLFLMSSHLFSPPHHLRLFDKDSNNTPFRLWKWLDFLHPKNKKKKVWDGGKKKRQKDSNTVVRGDGREIVEVCRIEQESAIS